MPIVSFFKVFNKSDFVIAKINNAEKSFKSSNENIVSDGMFPIILGKFSGALMTLILKPDLICNFLKSEFSIGSEYKIDFS